MPFEPPIYGLLGAGAGMLGASGPSRMPGGLGQAMGAGLSGFLQGVPLDQESERRKRAQSALGRISDTMKPAAVKAAWTAAAEPLAGKAGIKLAYLSNLAQSESGNRNIGQQINQTGSAHGPFQFTEGTWNQVITDHPELGLSPADRFLPAAQGRAAVVFTKDNSDRLSNSLGRVPTEAELGLAHRFGASGAIALLRSSRKQSVAAVLPNAVKANPQWAAMTVDDVIGNTAQAVGAEEPKRVVSSGGLLGGGRGTPVTTGGGLADLLGGGQIAPQPFGAGLENMTPQFREIMQIALSDPTLGPQALQTLMQIGVAQPEGRGARSQLPDKALNALLAGLQPGSPEWQAALVGGQETAKPTSAMKDAEALGLKPGSAEFDAYIRQRTLPQTPSSPSVTVIPQINTGGPAPVNKALDTRFNAAVEGGAAARQKLTQLDSVEQALQGLPTGKGATKLSEISGYLRGIGVDPTKLGLPDTASQAQVVDALIKPLVLELRNPAGGAGMPGAMSDKDREFLQKSTMSLENTPGANFGILMMQRRVQERNLAIEDLAVNHMERNNGNVAPSFIREVQAYASKTPLFDDEFKKQYDAAIKSPPPSVMGTPANQGGVGIQPPQSAVDYLKANPALAPQFDEKYGPGASSRFLR